MGGILTIIIIIIVMIIKIIHHDYHNYHGHVHDGYHRNDQTVDRWDDDQHHSQHHHRNNGYLSLSPKLSKNFHFQKTLATIVGRIRWDLGRMFLNGVHNSKQSRAPVKWGNFTYVQKVQKNLKIQKIRKQYEKIQK